MSYRRERSGDRYRDRSRDRFRDRSTDRYRERRTADRVSNRSDHSSQEGKDLLSDRFVRTGAVVIGSDERLIGEREEYREQEKIRRTSDEPSGPRQLRRGEQGKTPEEIDRYTKSGFVMSGSRSARMNMMREMQEAEEEKKDLSKRIEERSKKEDQIIDRFRKLLLEKQGRI
jgi:hypothetical protein